MKINLEIALAASALLLFSTACQSCGADENNTTPDAGKDQGVVQDMNNSGADQGADMAEEPDAYMEPDIGPPVIVEEDRHALHQGCYSLSVLRDGEERPAYLMKTEDASAHSFSGRNHAVAARFRFQASDISTYLLFDEERRYFVHDEGAFARPDALSSDFLENDDSYLPGAQWIVTDVEGGYLLQHLETGKFLGADGLVEEADAPTLVLNEAADCEVFPELTLDAEGEIKKTTWEDGGLYGIAETHSHLLSNFGFGGAGIFHGSAFHPLGVEHALPSCEIYHGKSGRHDLFGYGFDQGSELDQTALLQGLVTGRTPGFNHNTEGYPEFTDWPNAPGSSTHQTQYYKWLQRAHLGGLRLLVQHAATNRVICELIVGVDAQPSRYSCNDMVAVDRIIEETRNMERYIDAQSGGPGKGWFRIVESPAEAREVIAQGKLAIILGIETSHLFDCFLATPESGEQCTEEEVSQKLDEYHAKGVRALFPVHKYDNGFSAGDGSRDIIELGNFTQTGHWSNFTTDCPDLPSSFDKGDVTFGELNMPRDDYFAEPPNDTSGFAMDPVGTLGMYLELFMGGKLEGDYCQNAGLTPLGAHLIREIMKRGIILEIDHLPRRSYETVFNMLTEVNYPAVGSHGNNNRGKLYELGGVSKTSFGRCANPDEPKTRLNSLKNRIALIEAAGGYPGEGLGFDLNGFAGALGPRFSEEEPCGQPQSDPVTYPFTSLDGDITFTAPSVGNRAIDYNAEGLVHIGMLPELIEDLRHDGATEEDLEPLFRSAEAYLIMWEKSEARGKALSNPM